jgi:protein-tyrosine phosphatase
MKQILFVCLGNICRSPAAEAVFTHFIKKYHLENQIQCDSAGTASYHTGEKADYRMRKLGEKRGYQVTSIARKFDPSDDFERFDIIIGMDSQNVRDLKALANNESDRAKIHLMTDYCQSLDYDLVPDPYYGGEKDFELVIDILEDACFGLINEIQEEINS